MKCARNSLLKTSRSFLIAFMALPSGDSALASDTNDIVWQLNLKDGHPTNCQLAFTRVTQDDKSSAGLEEDTRPDKGAWHSCIALPKGLLKAGKDYVVTLGYQVIAQPSANGYFYVFARSTRLGYGADQWTRWSGDAGSQGVAKLRVSPTADDFVINVGILQQGAILIRNLKVSLGSGWTTIPLTRAFGAGAEPPAPSGAQPFTVDPPSNSNGPVLNLSDFGAVADGDAPPSAGPDRNLTAFKAAIARCRETKASKLIVPQGVYRITSGATIVFEGLSDFIFDGNGSTFLFHQIKGGAGIAISNCHRTIISNFNLDWDWQIDPLASVGRILKVAPDSSFFEMHFATPAPLDPKRWITMNPLDEKLGVPGTGQEIGGFNPQKIVSIDPQTVRLWPSRPVAPKVGQLYLLRHYTFEKHGILMWSNTHLSLQNVTIFSFPGIGFIVGGDQDHFELLHCRITYPDNEHRCITTTGDGFHVDRSQGYIRMEDCDFGYMGDDCVNIHDNFHAGIRVVDAHTLIAEGIVDWRCPFAAGDVVEIRKGDFSPTGFQGKLLSSKPNYKTSETTLVFDRALPSHLGSDSILFNLRYGSRNCVIQNCYFHENRARGILCNTANWLIEGNHFFHNQFSAILLLADVGGSWKEGFGAQNVIIRNSQFESSNSIGASDGAVVGIEANNNDSPTPYPLLQNFLFENNLFKEMTGPAIQAASFKNLVIRQNKFINVDKAPLVLPMRGSIRAELGGGLWVEGNEWTTQKGFASPNLAYDAETTTKVVCKTNQLNAPPAK
jgi:hypothetical protein